MATFYWNGVSQWSHSTGMGSQSMSTFYWNGESVNGHILLEWGLSQWPHSTGMGSQSKATFYWNGESVNGNIERGWGYSSVNLCQSNLCNKIYSDIRKKLKKKILKKRRIQEIPMCQTNINMMEN